MTDQPSRRRSILKNVLTLSECHELILIARCCSAVGYRENCCAVTSTAIARICPHFLPKLVRSVEVFILMSPTLPPYHLTALTNKLDLYFLLYQVSIRERIQDAVEDAIGFQLSAY